MNLMKRWRRNLTTAVMAGLLCVGAGCNREVAAELATLTGGYIGDIVSAVATAYLQALAGATADGDVAGLLEDGGPLHEHHH